MNPVAVSQELENDNKEIKIEKIEDWNINREDLQFSTGSGVFITKLENNKKEEAESIDIKVEDLHHIINIKDETSVLSEPQVDQDRRAQICKQSKYGALSRSRSRDFRNYSVEVMNNALNAIQNDNISVREASRRFGVPRGTLHNRIHGRVKIGPGTVLSKQEENDLENWLISITKRGFPLKKADLLNSAKSIISASDRKTPFRNNQPGMKWYSLFLKRHPKLALQETECFTKAMEAPTKEYTQQWFREFRLVLEQHDALDILDDPSRIFSGDEASFSWCPISGKILAPKDAEKETITVFIIFSADGKALPPMVVFPLIRSKNAIGDSIPSEWVLGQSENGWMTNGLFFEYLTDRFDKWIGDNNISRPVLLFVDGHKSHLSMELSRFCDSLGIILYALPANTTQVMQPLKTNWQTQSENLTQFTFCSLLKSVLGDEKLPETIRDVFRKCGLLPLNSEAAECFLTQIESDEDKKSYKITKTNLEITQCVLAKLQDIFLDRGITNINAIQKELEIVKSGISENHSLAVLSNSEQKSSSETSKTATMEVVPEKIRENPNKINILQNITLYKNKTPSSMKTQGTKTSIMQDITVSPKVNTDILRKRLVSPATRRTDRPPVISSAKLRKLLQQKLDKHKETENEQEKSRLECFKKAAGGSKKRKKNDNKITNQTGTCKIKEKCAICSDDLESDTEKNDFKNVGCDQCPRWYHLKCTLFRGSNYLDVADSDFICTFCATRAE